MLIKPEYNLMRQFWRHYQDSELSLSECARLTFISRPLLKYILDTAAEGRNPQITQKTNSRVMKYCEDRNIGYDLLWNEILIYKPKTAYTRYFPTVVRTFDFISDVLTVSYEKDGRYMFEFARHNDRGRGLHRGGLLKRLRPILEKINIKE